MRSIFQLLCHDIVKEGDDIWLWDCGSEALYRWDTLTGNVEHFGDFNVGKQSESYNSLVDVGDRIIGIPSASNRIMIFDKANGLFRFVPLERVFETQHKYKSLKFKCGILAENKIYMSGYSPFVLEFDLESEQISRYIKLPIEDLKEDFFTFTSEGILVGDKMYIPACNEPIIFELDIHTFEIKMHEIDGLEDGFFAGGSIGNGYLYLVPQERDCFIEYDSKKRQHIIIPIDKTLCGMRYKRNGSMFYWNGDLWCVSMSFEKLAGINVSSKRSVVQKAYTDYLKNIETDSRELVHPTMTKQIREYVYFLMEPKHEFIRLNLMTDKVEVLEYAYSEKEERDRWYEYNFFHYRINKDQVIREQDGDLLRFLRAIVNKR